MATTPSAASVAQNVTGGKCPQCGSPLVVRWSWAGGRGERLAVRCTMESAPVDETGQRWCDFGGQLEGNEALFAGVTP